MPMTPRPEARAGKTRAWSQLCALCLLGTVLVGCSTASIRPDPPRMSLVGLALEHADLFEQRYRLRLRLQNPNDREISIKGMDYELFLNGSPFAHGVSAHSTTLPPYGEVVAELDVVSTLSNMLEQLRSLGETEALSYRLVGNIKLSYWPARIPFEYAGKITPPAP